MKTRSAAKKTEPDFLPQAFRIQAVRDWIAGAEQAGAQPSDLLLRLTARDAAALKRHPQVALHEVSFSSGVMRFLGVEVREGGVSQSVLERGEA